MRKQKILKLCVRLKRLKGDEFRGSFLGEWEKEHELRSADKIYFQTEYLKPLQTKYPFMLTVIVSGLLLVGVFSAQCPLSQHQQSQLYSDSIKIEAHESEITHGQNLLYNYQFDEVFHSHPQVAFGINEFVSDESPIMEIKITNSQLKNDGLQFQVQSKNESEWKKIKINFISSTRDDMEFGTASTATPSSEEIFQIAYPLVKEFSSIGLKVKPFIQSFDLESQNKQEIGIKLQDTDIEGDKIYFTFSNIHRVSIIRSLTLSIIVFNIYNPGVLYAEGIIDQNYVVSTTSIHIPRHGINELRTYIVGINSFRTSAAQPISIASAIDETFTLMIGPIDRQQIDFVSVSYLILSVVDCGSCSGYPLLFKGICKTQGPLGYFQRNGKCFPIECTNGFQVGPKGTCIPQCGQNQQYSEETDKCECIDDYHPIDGKCIKCFVGTYYNYRTMTCDSLCGSNAFYQDGRCYCYPGYYVIENRCQSCPKGTAYDTQTRSCESICKKKQVFRGERCVCQEGFYNISGECDQCPSNTIYNSLFGRCECIEGLQYNQKLNRCVPICTQFEELVGEVCQCKSSYIRIQGVCGQCPTHSIYFFFNQKCYCKFGFKEVDGKCQCPSSQIYSETQNKCVKRCPQPNYLYIDGKCQCPDDFVLDENGRCDPKCGVFQERINGKCQCIEGYYKGVRGPCVPISCPPGFRWDRKKRQCRTQCTDFNQTLVNGVCECIQGYSKDLIYGICLPSCPNNQVRVNNKCICSPGNKIIDGVCTNCPRHSQYVNGICLCYNGNLPIDGQCQKFQCSDPNLFYDSISKTCKCKGPLIFMRGRCQYIRGCGQNEYWCGTMCACHYGYVRMNGKCMKSTDVAPVCPPYSTFNPVSYKCVCQRGYHPVRPYACQKCTQSSYWDGHKCNNDVSMRCAQGYVFDSFSLSCVMEVSSCGVNEYRDGLQCKCKKGYFWINGQCHSCGYRQYFDGVSCVGFPTQQCSDPYKFWNGEGCVCQPEFFEYGDSCVRCPEGARWNGFCCRVGAEGVGDLIVVNGY